MRIPLPLLGLNDNLAYSEQPPTTSRDLVNVVSVDPVTNRIRLSQVSGTSRYCPARVADSKVALMAQITTDARKMAYSANAGTSESSVITASAQACRVAVADRQGNIYLNDGNAGIAKYNKDFAKVWVLSPPVKDPSSIIRALWVDTQDRIYIGVSEGGVQKLARFWRFDQQKSGPPKQVWQYPPEPAPGATALDGAFVEKIITRGDLVYTAQNFPDRWGSEIVVYRGGLGTGLTLAWRKVVAYPVRDFDLKADGSVIGCSSAFANRGLDPRFRNFTQKTEDWQITDLADYQQRIWGDWDADQFLKNFPDTKDGDAAPVFIDESGNNRDIFTYGGTVTGSSTLFHTDPLYAEHGIGAKPAIHFRGQQVGPPQFADVYQSQYSYSVTNTAGAQHRGLVPGIQGSRWAIFMAFAPEEDKTGAEKRRGVWGQPITVGGTDPFLGLYSNRSSGGTSQSGVGSFADQVNAAGVGVGTGTQPMHFVYQEAPPLNWPPNDVGGAGVLTILWDGGTTTTTDGPTDAHSLLRWNGKPIDRWKSLTGAFAGTTDPSDIGTTINAFLATFGSFRGYIRRIIVLRDFVDAPQGLISHPHYPWGIHNATTAPVPPTVPVGLNLATDWVATDTEMEKIEGMLAHGQGTAHLLDSGTYAPPTFASPNVAPFTPTNPGNWPHPYTLANGPPRKLSTASRSEAFQMHNPEGLVFKLDGAKGDIKWVCAPDRSNTPGGGMGTSVAVDSSGNIGSLGSAIETTVTGAIFNYDASALNVRKIIDLNGVGTSGFEAQNISGNSSWGDYLDHNPVPTPPPFENPFSAHARIAFDDQDNLYVPMSPYPGGDQYSLIVYAPWVSQTPFVTSPWESPAWPVSLNQGERLATYLSQAGDIGNCVVVNPSPPYRFGAVYDWDRAPTLGSRTARTEFAYLGVSQPTPIQSASVWKARLVTATAVTGPPRMHTLIMIVDGFVKKFSSAGITDFAGASTINQSVTPALDPTAEYYDSFEAFGKLFITDGKTYVYVDPINDAVLKWKATDGGAIPERYKLGVNWRGRATLARGVDNVHNWGMAELGDPFHWNKNTVPATLPTRSITGDASRVGLCPDLINAMIPYSDNQLVLLGDHSVWAMTGDPADEGQPAAFRQMSDSTGGAFGRPWCKDPEGNVYFFGSRGGVYVMRTNLSLVSISPAPQSLTEDTIDQRLMNVDLAVHRVEMAWNTAESSLIVVLIPFTAAEGTSTHFLWHSRTKSWSERTFGFTVSALLNIDGDDADDRRLLIAGTDGYVRVWDSAAKNDDGVSIETRALIGPIRPPKPLDTKREFRFRNLVCELAAEQDSVLVNIYGSNRPDNKGTVRWSGLLQPGRSIIPVTITAGYVWIELRQAHSQRRWSIESLEWESVVPAGRMSVGA